MKPKFYLLSLMICLSLLSIKDFAGVPNSEGLRAYIFFSFENPNMFRDSTFKNEIKSKIIKIFEEQGVIL